MPSVRALPWIAALSLLAAACSDRTVPVLPREAAPEGVAPLQPVGPSQSQSLVCHADVKAMRVDCADDAPNLSSARGDIIVGGQNLYVKLTSSNLSYNSVTGGAFTFDVTVKNLIPQAMGTNDGTTGDGTGVRVFFQTMPSATSGTGTIAVTNPTGTNGTFTNTNQTYFQYAAASLGGDGILSQNETSSAMNWHFDVPNTVTTFSFTLYVSANVPNPNGYITLSPGSASVLESGTQALSATVKSAVGNTITGQTISWGTSNSAVATVASDGTVTAVAPGSATITATAGARSGTTSVTVCPNLALGGVSVITGPTAASFCLAGGSGNEYVVVPYNGDPAATLGVNVTGTGITAVSGVPTPYLGASSSPVDFSIFSPAPDYSFENGLRAREHQLEPMIPTARARMAALRTGAGRLSPNRGASRTITSGVPTLGQQMTLNVNGTAACTSPVNATATVKSIGTHSIIMAQDDNNPTNTFTQAEYDAFATSFDNTVYPLVTGAFGLPADIDNNGGRIVILFTRAVNQMTPSGSSSYIGGFVFARDLIDATSCPTSNLGEMFYMLAPDSTGIDGNVRTATMVKGVTTGTLAHEFQHLINASRRIYVNSAPGFEVDWLDEGLAHISEELLFYNQSGLTSRSGINLATIIPQPTQSYFFSYAEANFGRLRQHLLSPETTSPQQSGGGVSLETRGSIWAFLRYAADRALPSPADQSTFFRALVNSTTSGRANLTAVLGTSVDPWFRDYAAAIYAADMGVGTVSSTYSMPSWNFRSIYGGLNYGSGVGYPLVARNPASGVASSSTLALGGGASYIRMGVPTSTFAPVTITKAGGGALPSTFSTMVIRRK